MNIGSTWMIQSENLCCAFSKRSVNIMTQCTSRRNISMHGACLFRMDENVVCGIKCHR